MSKTVKSDTRILIRFHYGIWYPVSKREARRFCEFLMYRMTCPDEEKKRLIKEKYLKGITLAELFDENEADNEREEGGECKEGSRDSRSHREEG